MAAGIMPSVRALAKAAVKQVCPTGLRESGRRAWARHHHGIFAPVKPWPMPEQKDCVFYHFMSYPDGTHVDGAWDIRGQFDQYIGHYPIKGKTLLDVGTAGGFLAIEAEKAGAVVTALDGSDVAEFERVPFGGLPYQDNRALHNEQMRPWYTQLRNGFWYSWHKSHSNVEMVYAPLAKLPYWGRQFDVVLAGAIIEHLCNPVAMIADIAGRAKEAVIIAFTPVHPTDELMMKTVTDWGNPAHNFSFWILSRGLYTRIFNNLGFDVEYVPSYAMWGGANHARETIIARRRR